VSSEVFPWEEGWRLITREHAIAASANVARKHGYALGVHGSRCRDVDLVAVPWTDEAADPELLVDAIASAIPGTVIGAVTSKPHGRKAWAIYPRYGTAADHWYVDLSVMPRRPLPVWATDEAERRRRVSAR
jgi:hypothetical protein